MGIIERKERQKQTLRKEILTAALEVFAKEGYQQLSMRRLADKIEYSPATIYLHFKDKADLFECVCNETFSQLAELFEHILNGSADPLEALRLGCSAYVNFGLEHPDQYCVAFLADSGQRWTLEDAQRICPMAFPAFNHLLAGVTRCIEAGEFAGSDAVTVSHVIWAGLHGITSLLIVKPGFPWGDRERLVECVVESMIRSFRRQ